MRRPRFGRIPLKNRLRQFASGIGPGIFILGYIIGTGSVTSMASAGARYGMSLTWALALSCLFTYVMIVAISRCTIVSGQTLISVFRKHFGSGVAVFTIVSLMLTVVTSIMGVMGILTDVVREWTRPLTASGAGVSPVFSCLVFTGLLYYLFWKGTHGLFLRAMALIVALMGVCFILTMVMVIPSPAEMVRGLVPGIPSEGRAHLILAGMVGTTMASVCLVTRSYLVAEKGWSLKDLKAENRDAMISLTLTFVVSAAIVASAAGTLYVRGIEVEHAIDMVTTLEPLAGGFAASLFVFGIVAAALSSLFPNYLLGAWLISDYLNVRRDMRRAAVRVFVLAVASLGFVVPLFGGRPVLIMVASQAVSPVVMPMLIVLTLVVLNRRSIAQGYKNPVWLNVALVVTLLFSLLMSYSATLGLLEFLTGDRPQIRS